MLPTDASAYKGLSIYYGDLHNHCGLSYGHGSLAAALHNPRLQLDFASITVHAHWPDLPSGDPQLGYLIDYHEQGFRKALDVWPHYLMEVEQTNQEGVFLTFPSYEWHSMQYGDYCVYYQDGEGGAEARPILRAKDLNDLRDGAKQLHTPAFIIPHHIAYQRGHRGINWSAFSEELSPVAEIFSFHGLSETSEGPYPYLHSMGPRDERSTARYGWEQGHVFGVIGSTDHHNAFPGSYGYGRMGVWAEALSRDAVWTAIAQRRTYALTGDRIDLAFSVNDRPMGAILGSTDDRWIDVAIRATDSIGYVDVLHNGRIIHRESLRGNRREQPV